MDKEQLTVDDLHIIAALCRAIKDMPILNDIDLEGIADRALNIAGDMQSVQNRVEYQSTVTRINGIPLTSYMERY